MDRPVARFLGAWWLMELWQWTGFAAVTYVMLEDGGVAQSAAVQAVPLLVVSLLAPVLGALLDHHSARRVMVIATALLAAKSLGHVWLQWQWYAALMVIDAALLAALHQAYVRLLPALIPEGQIDRVSGWGTIGANVVKALGLTAGPLLAVHLRTCAFVLIAGGHGLAAALLARSPGDAPAAPLTRGRRAPAVVAGGVLRGLRHLLGTRDQVATVIVLLLAHALWGLEGVLELSIAERGLGITPAWTGTYAAMGTLAAMPGAALIARGALGSGARVVETVGSALVVLSATCWAVRYASTPAAGFALKLAGGLAAAVIGVLCQNALVLRHPAELRGRLLGLLTAMGGLVMVASKAAAGHMSADRSAAAIYAGGGGLILALAVALLVIHGGRRA